MKVLVADDDLSTRLLLQELLEQWGYEVALAEDGAKAWGAMQGEGAPQLMVLDWIMPRISGIDLCQMLKSRRACVYTYTILLTSKAEKEDVIAGLESGADDFLVKPVHPDELRSRLAVGARSVKYEQVLAEKNELVARYASEMQALAEERARQLVHADRMATLGVMSAGIAHEINNPTSFISGNVQTLQMFWNEIEACLLRSLADGFGEARKLEFILREMPKALEGMRGGVSRISRIVKGLKTFARQDKGERVPCRVDECVGQALELCHNALKRHVTVERDLGQGLPEIRANPQQIEQILVNLFVNAAQAMAPQGGGTLKISARASRARLKIMVEDTGPGVPEEELESIWNPFFTTKGHHGTGLGLSISQGIVEEHGGVIWAENRAEGGARFVIELPTHSEETQ